MSQDPRPTLLALDDEPDNLDLVARTFRSSFDVVTATAVERALEVGSERPVEVIIADQRLPAGTGVDFLAEAIRRWPQAVRLLVSAYLDVDTLLASINNGRVHGCLAKPLRMDDLRTAVEQARRARDLEVRNSRLVAELTAKNAELDARAREIERLRARLDEGLRWLNAEKRDVGDQPPKR